MTQPKEPVLVLFDRAMMGHDPGDGHPERSDRLRALEAVFTEMGDAVTVDSPREATREELVAVHTHGHVDRMLELDDQFASIDGDTRVSPGSLRAARLAAGAAVTAVDAMMAERSRVFVAARPPGHHAEADRAMGFCLFNNVAVAAAHARARHGLERILIIDWDAHHGNGTQHIFWTDPNVLFVSAHQFPFYPGTGDVGESGMGAGEGKTVNVPLRAGATDADYRFAFREIVEPIADAFAPQIVLVSAGFDAHRLDPLAQMQMTDEGFADLCAGVQRIADRHAQGRMGLFLEGGYDIDGLAESTRSCLQIMNGSTPPQGAATASPTRERQLRDVIEAHRRHWSNVLV
jgi:acetoin utilization deacetylase AcuC-like enzyme